MSIFYAGVLVACGIAFGLSARPAEEASGNTFAGLTSRAMLRMDKDMMAAPSGDSDRDFATMMIPHHQGAIDMAKAELLFGHDRVLRRLAEGMVVEQQQEIAVMRDVLAGLPPSSPAAATPTGAICRVWRPAKDN